MSRIGEIVKNAREKMGLSRKALGKKLGVSESYVLDLETGRKVAPEDLTKRISKVLDVKLDGINYDEEEAIVRKELAMPLSGSKLPNPNRRGEGDKTPKEEVKDNWRDAFSSIIKSIPVYDLEGTNIKYFKGVPADQKLIEGYNLDKNFYVEIEDDSMSHWRLRKGDLVLCAKTKAYDTPSIYYLHIGGIRCLRFVKRLDQNSLIVLSGRDGMDTQSVREKDVDIVGKCFKAEINL